jgi:hypothetical protein
VHQCKMLKNVPCIVGTNEKCLIIGPVKYVLV